MKMVLGVETTTNKPNPCRRTFAHLTSAPSDFDKTAPSAMVLALNFPGKPISLPGAKEMAFENSEIVLGRNKHEVS
jgi:hypothetical protein